MKKDSAKISVEGIDDVVDILSNIGPTKAANLMRATVHGVAGEIRNEAKSNVRSSAKDTGNLYKAIKAKRNRARNRFKPSSSVVITRGKSSKNNAWYWRFTEYGTRDGTREIAWGRRAISSVKQNLNVTIKANFTSKLKAALKRAQKARAKT